MTRSGAAIAIVALILSALLTDNSFARSGAACGNVAVVDAQGKAYGYSAISEQWTGVTLESPAIERLAGEYLGYLRTSFRLYSYNSTNDHWYWCTHNGTPLGESSVGATTLAWTSTYGYAIASLWSSWRTRAWDNNEQPLGGGSCGSFALVWTTGHAYAFHSATGQWMVQDLSEPVSGGITCNDFGLVWTPHAVYSFDAYPGGWVPLDLGVMDGISVTGNGDVALAWSPGHADAYSSMFQSWFPISSVGEIISGTASGSLALFWSNTGAWVFDANTGEWTGVPIPDDGSGGDKPPEEFEQHFRVHPNPTTSDRLQMFLPGDEEWQVEVFDVSGRRLQSLRAPKGGPTVSLEWDRTDDTGRRLAAGTYWVRARSEKSTEVRRVLLLN